jgi:hypothetical protein
MPIQAEPDGTLDVENATLRSRNIVSLTNMVAGNDVVRSTAAPTLEVYGDPSNDGGVLPTLELVSNVGAAGSAFTRLTSNAGVFTIQSGTAGTADSKGDIAFSSVGGDTEHMRIQGSTGNVGIGTTPEVPLNVVGNNALSGTPNNAIASFRATTSVPGTNDAGVVIGSINGNTPYIADVSTASTGLSFYTQNANRMKIDQTGNVEMYSGRLRISTGVTVNGYDDITDAKLIIATGGRQRIFTDNGDHLWFSSAGGNGTLAATTILTLTNYYYRVGIGKTNPDARLHIKQLGTGYTHGIRIEHPTTTWRWDIIKNSSNDLTFAHNGTAKAFFDQNGGNNVDQNFTGQHRTFIKDIPFTRAVELEGLIVSADNNKYIKMTGGIEAGSNAITTNESLPVVSLSTKVKDKKCFGVISASEDPETRENRFGNMVSVSQKELGDTRIYINSVGEGAIWVTNINGPLESGDYITTSNVAGYGQKQDSEFLANYTVAKITMDCDFEPVTQPIQKIKKELGDVNYWVKTTYKNVSEKEYSNLNEENRTITTETIYTNEDGEVNPEFYSNLESNVQSTYTELTRTVYQKIIKEESKTEQEGYELEVRNELANVLDEHGQLQWEDTDETEKAYKIRYLDADGNITDEANQIYKAAFVGCTYHCG